MQGFKFLIIDKQGKPASHGTILQMITPERYLCHFARVPSSCRIHRLEVLENWHLFPNDDDMNAYIAAIVKRNEPPPPPKKKPRKKKPRKKTLARARELANKVKTNDTQ